MTELHWLSAHEVLAQFRTKSLSPVEYLDALLARAEALEPALGAVAEWRAEEARAEARTAADRYAGTGQAARPLEGLAVAAKEEHPMAGRSWRQGSFSQADVVADVDHPIIDRIQAAGGIIHLRTTTPEFCCTPYCHSRMWGVTRNPWNTDYSPGGSSGGSGAALAAGYAPLATGSDIGGSIRIPASLSGVVGYKPPWARVPALAPYNLDQYCHDGPMARTVADTALLEDVIAGRHWCDTASLADPPQVAGAGSDVRGLRIALCVRLGDWPLDDGIEANTRAVAAHLAAAGATVTEVTLPWSADHIWEVANAHFNTIMGAGIAAIVEEHAAELNDYTHAFAASVTAPGLSFYEGMEAEGDLWLPLGRLFEAHDVVLCPTMATAGYVAGQAYLGDSFAIGGSTVSHHILGAMTLPFNMFSRCPVLSVPSGRAGNGVPTGVQIVGRPYDDVTAFRVAAAAEGAGAGFTQPGWRPAGLPWPAGLPSVTR